VPEVRRLLWARTPDPEAVLAWSRWRRCYQQRLPLPLATPDRLP
jgi:hypothetical protein